MPVTVDESRCAQLALRLRELDLHAARYATIEGALPGLRPPQLREYYFFLCALLFDFKGMRAELHGKEYLGSDLFFALAEREVRRDPHAFAAERMARITAQDFDTIFSVDRDPTRPSTPRGAARARLLRETAAALQDRYGGSLESLLLQAGGYLRREDGKGLLDALSVLPGYLDPHLKKAFVLLKIWQRLGLWEARDKANLFIPVDYHLLRVALRSGMVRVEAPAWQQRLRDKAAAAVEEEEQIRAAVKRAYKRVEELSGIDVFTLDELFWTLGRSCCHHDRAARCAACDRTYCSVTRSFDYACPGRCPLSSVCAGARDPAHRALFEPMIETVYY
jgi:hypothetical protein